MLSFLIKLEHQHDEQEFKSHFDDHDGYTIKIWLKKLNDFLLSYISLIFIILSKRYIVQAIDFSIKSEQVMTYNFSIRIKLG